MATQQFTRLACNRIVTLLMAFHRRLLVAALPPRNLFRGHWLAALTRTKQFNWATTLASDASSFFKSLQSKFIKSKRDLSPPCELKPNNSINFNSVN